MEVGVRGNFGVRRAEDGVCRERVAGEEVFVYVICIGDLGCGLFGFFIGRNDCV